MSSLVISSLNATLQWSTSILYLIFLAWVRKKTESFSVEFPVRWATIKHLFQWLLFNQWVILKRLMKKTRILNFHQTVSSSLLLLSHRLHHRYFFISRVATRVSNANVGNNYKCRWQKDIFLPSFSSSLRLCDMIHIERLHYLGANKLKKHVFIGMYVAGLYSKSLRSWLLIVLNLLHLIWFMTL